MCIAINGNSLELIYNIPSNYFNFIFLDPPYGNTVKEDWDLFNPVIESSNFINELHRVLLPNGSIYICCGIGRQSQSLIELFPLFNNIFSFQENITWVKSRGIGMRKGWLFTTENLLWFSKHPTNYIWNKEFQYSTEHRKRDASALKKGKLTLGNNGKKRKSEFKRLTNVWHDIPDQTPDITSKNKVHKTPKPEKLIERLLLLHTNVNDIIFDPFAGTSTTGAIAKKMNRQYYLIEENKKYCNFSDDYYGIKYL